jgi:hypothetical protein
MWTGTCTKFTDIALICNYYTYLPLLFTLLYIHVTCVAPLPGNCTLVRFNGLQYVIPTPWPLSKRCTDIPNTEMQELPFIQIPLLHALIVPPFQAVDVKPTSTLHNLLFENGRAVHQPLRWT